MNSENTQAPYTVPEGARIGHIHLQVSDLERSLAFYRDLLGFTITQRYGADAVFLSSGIYHHHLGLNVWNSKNAGPADKRKPGLYHTAILYPTEEDLGRILARLLEHKVPLTGAADHGVSKALYLDDPDGNGVELYWDRPFEEWPRTADGSLDMYTRPLDLKVLMTSIK